MSVHWDSVQRKSPAEHMLYRASENRLKLRRLRVQTHNALGWNPRQGFRHFAKETLNMIETLTISLNNGQKHPATAYPAGWSLPDSPGVYLFLKKHSSGWDVLYVGEASNLNNRSGAALGRHEKYSNALILGLTHVAFIPLNAFFANNRFELERIFCASFQPPLNKQLVA